MKRDRHGKAKILTPDEIELLLSERLTSHRDRMLFDFCLYTACRVNEACTQLTVDGYGNKGHARPELIIRKGNSKGQLKSNTIPTAADLAVLLTQHKTKAGDGVTFTQILPHSFCGKPVDELVLKGLALTSLDALPLPR